MSKTTGTPFNIFNAIAVTSSQSYTSSNTSVLYRDTVGYQVNLSGSLVGTLQVNGSNDWNPQLPESGNPHNSSGSGNWVTLSSTSIAPTTASPVYFNLTQVGFAYIQCQYISSSGSGTLTGWIVSKSLGA